MIALGEVDVIDSIYERAEADRLRDQLNRQQKLNGFVVRFQPENG